MQAPHSAIPDRLMPAREAEKSMGDAKMLQHLKELLFSPGYDHVFTILDGASVPDLPKVLRSFKVEHICLYRGAVAPDMAEVAPYLCSLKRDSLFLKYLLSEGWGMHWGMFGTSDADLQALAVHFGRFLKICDDSGKELYFRFYDPRVWRTFLPTCSAEELQQFFGPVLAYFVEDNEPKTVTRLMLRQQTLLVEAFSVS